MPKWRGGRSISTKKNDAQAVGWRRATHNLLSLAARSLHDMIRISTTRLATRAAVPSRQGTPTAIYRHRHLGQTWWRADGMPYGRSISVLNQALATYLLSSS